MGCWASLLKVFLWNPCKCIRHRPFLAAGLKCLSPILVSTESYTTRKLGVPLPFSVPPLPLFWHTSAILMLCMLPPQRQRDQSIFLSSLFDKTGIVTNKRIHHSRYCSRNGTDLTVGPCSSCQGYQLSSFVLLYGANSYRHNAAMSNILR